MTAELAATHDLIPLIEAQFFTQATVDLARPLDEATRQIYRQSAAAFAERYRPAYLGLGIEVNLLAEQSPDDFDDCAELFSNVYDSVKIVSPETRVFTVFQLERSKGLHGGLFGGTDDPAATGWSSLDRFPKADLLAFSTDPGFVYRSPAELPDDYYNEIRLHTAKAIAFTEIGWHSDAGPAGWESSEAEQAHFVGRFFDLTRELNIEMAIWSFLHDPDTFEPFRSMGLRHRSDGGPKLAWDKWIDVR